MTHFRTRPLGAALTAMSTQPSRPEPPSPPAGRQSVSVQFPVHVQPPQQPRPPGPPQRAVPIETHLVLSSTHLYPRPCLVFPDSSPFSPPVTHIILPLHSYPLRLSLDSRPKVLSYHHRLGSKRRLLLFYALHSASSRHQPSPSHFLLLPPFRSFSIQPTAAAPSSVPSAGTRPLPSLAVPSLLVPTTTIGTDRHVTCPPHSLHIEIPAFRTPYEPAPHYAPFRAARIDIPRITISNKIKSKTGVPLVLRHDPSTQSLTASAAGLVVQSPDPRYHKNNTQGGTIHYSSIHITFPIWF